MNKNAFLIILQLKVQRFIINEFLFSENTKKKKCFYWKKGGPKIQFSKLFHFKTGNFYSGFNLLILNITKKYFYHQIKPQMNRAIQYIYLYCKKVKT